MEYEKIKQLMEDMGNSKLSSIEIDFPDGTKINMKKEETKTAKIVNGTKEEPEQETVQTSKTEATSENNNQEEAKVVNSPMVGTFYSKPSPNSQNYVEVGTKVKKGDILCIIEAMKLMNEIESEFDGEIKEILVKDGDTVEYGKPLFKIV